MLHTRCKTTCSKPKSFLRGGRRKRTPSKPHQGRKEMPLLGPWRFLFKHVIVKKKRSFFHEHTNVKRPQKPRRSSTAPSKTLLQKTEALEKYVKTVTMRAETLATTEADFKTLLDRQEEAQNHLNELSAQLSQQNTTTRSTQCKPHSAERRNKHTREAQSLFFFVHLVRVRRVVV